MDDTLKAGKIASKALQKGLKLIKKEKSIVEILDEIEEYILNKNAGLAFPAQISLNHVAAHQCSTDINELLKETDLVKLDVGAEINGYIGDNARTISLNNNNELIKASDKALNEALKIAKPGTTIKEIGSVIQKEIEEQGFKPIRNLSGHGLEKYNLHSKPSVPNIKTNDNTELKENQVVAIEPFATDGMGLIYESGNPTIFSVINSKPVRSLITRNVLKEIQKYKNLPFTTRWLYRKFGEGRTNFAINELKQKNIITSHPPLVEQGKGLVSQSEHTVIIKDKPIITTK